LDKFFKTNEAKNTDIAIPIVIVMVSIFNKVWMKNLPKMFNDNFVFILMLKCDVFRLFGFPVCMAGIEDKDFRMFVRSVASIQSKEHLTTKRHFQIVSIRFPNAEVTSL